MSMPMQPTIEKSSSRIAVILRQGGLSDFTIENKFVPSFSINVSLKEKREKLANLVMPKNILSASPFRTGKLLRSRCAWKENI
jgi:hypothetical protein